MFGYNRRSEKHTYHSCELPRTVSFVPFIALPERIIDFRFHAERDTGGAVPSDELLEHDGADGDSVIEMRMRMTKGRNESYLA